MITQQRLKELVHYNPDTGVFTWLISRQKIKAGNRAGSVNVLPKSNYAYRRIKLDAIEYKEHRLAWLYMTGEMPVYPEYEIDHKDGNSLNNKWINLRKGTHSQNTRNCGPAAKNTLKQKGVYLIKGKYRACLYENKRLRYLGVYTDKEQAIAAYEAARSVRDADLAT